VVLLSFFLLFFTFVFFSLLFFCSFFFSLPFQFACIISNWVHNHLWINIRAELMPGVWFYGNVGRALVVKRSSWFYLLSWWSVLMFFISLNHLADSETSCETKYLLISKHKKEKERKSNLFGLDIFLLSWLRVGIWLFFALFGKKSVWIWWGLERERVHRPSNFWNWLVVVFIIAFSSFVVNYL